MSTFGERVKEIRMMNKLTQKDFASRLGITPSYVSKLEADKEKSSETLEKLICAEFWISDEWLASGTGEMKASANDYDKFDSTLVSGTAILELVELLKTPSNVKYSHYSYMLELVTEFMQAEKLSEKNVFPYLEDMELLLANVDRLFWVTRSLLLDKNVSDTNVKEIPDILKGHMDVVKDSLIKVVEDYLSESLDMKSINKQDYEYLLELFSTMKTYKDN